MPRSIPRHLEASSPQFFAHAPSHVQLGDSRAQLTASVTAETRDRMEVLIQWKNAPERQLHYLDWIGAFDEKLLTQFHAPVKFRYVFPAGEKPPLPTSGSMNFTVHNLRSSYVFIYISGNQQYPEIIAQSQPIRFSSVSHPQTPHIALSPSDPTKMLVMWTQDSPQKPLLKWGSSPDQLQHWVHAKHDTYTKRDFCDNETSPAGRQGWFDPGFFLTAEMPIEHGKIYYYTCGDSTDDNYLLEIRNFTAPPASDSDSTRLILFADLGNAPADGSLHHSWDFDNHGELPSRNTTRLAEHLLDKEAAHAVVHFGDIAYSVGYLSEWDEFMMQIEPVASRIPWMASIGNHEVGWSESDPFNGTLKTDMDSGGECGVAFLKRFPFAMQPLPSHMPWRNAHAWYSFEIGAVHFVMLSSEHDFSTGSPQWKWMVNDLQLVDRSKIPWVAVTSHRAMYIASSYSGDQDVAKLLQVHIEPQLLKYHVDFFFAGHHHSYQRFCRLNAGECVENQKGKHGIYHFVMGMAGYDHSPVASGVKETKFTDDIHWGATYWDFGQTSATMKFIDGASDEVIDTAVFKKDSATTSEVVI